MDDLHSPEPEDLKPAVYPPEGPEAAVPEETKPPEPAEAPDTTQTDAPPEPGEAEAPPPVPPVPPTPPQPEGPGQAAPRRPFFSDTWEIFKRMFSSKFSRMLAIAAADSRGIWLPNLIVCLAAELVGLILLVLRGQALLNEFYYSDLGGLGAGLVIGGILSFAAADLLLILAVKVLSGILKQPVSLKRAANVTSCVLLVPAASVLAGGLLGLILPVLACICIGVGSAAAPLLLYVGVKQLTGPETEPAWPFIWTMLVYECAVGLSTGILLLICLGSSLLYSII